MSKLPEANGHRSVRRCPRTVSMVMPCTPVACRKTRSSTDRGLAYNRRMQAKEQLVENWLQRSTGLPLDPFGGNLLLTHFFGYLCHLARLSCAQFVGTGRPPPLP